MARKNEAPETAETKPVETTGLKVESNDEYVGLTIEDNTNATEVEVREVSVEKVELIGGLFQENFA